MKKYKRHMIIALCIIIAYEIIGALLPFAIHKKVKNENILQTNIDDYKSQDGGVDRASIIKENKDALTVRLEMLENAKESIVMATFDIREGNSTTDIFSSILAAADRGVNVQILVDGFSGLTHMTGKSIFQAVGTHPNVEIRFYNTPNLLKPWTFNGRFHDKYLIVDDKLLLVGGRNIFDYFIGSYPNKSSGHDLEVLIYNSNVENTTGSVISTVKNYFEETWKLPYCKKTLYKKTGSSITAKQEELLEHYKQLQPTVQIKGENEWQEDTMTIGKATFLTNPTHIVSKEPYIWYQLEQLMLSGKEKVSVYTPYAVFSKDMYKSMAKIAETVPYTEMLINSVAVGDNVMAASDYTLNKKKVIKTGVQILEYFGDRSCHGKALTVDNDISVIGSFNFDMRSAYIDTETMLVIYDEEFNTELTKQMNKLKEKAIAVDQNGDYIVNDQISPIKLKTSKKVIYGISSWVIQLIRYLV